MILLYGLLCTEEVVNRIDKLRQLDAHNLKSWTKVVTLFFEEGIS